MHPISRKNLYRVIFCSLFVGALLFLVHRYWYTMTVPIPVQEDDIREAVLHQGLGEQLADCGPEKVICCISLEGKGDPTDVFLARFQGRFRKGSECEREKGSPLPTHVRTGKPVSIVEVGSVLWLGLTDARVSASVLCGPLCGLGVTVRIHRENNSWIVVERLVGWVS